VVSLAGTRQAGGASEWYGGSSDPDDRRHPEEHLDRTTDMRQSIEQELKVVEPAISSKVAAERTRGGCWFHPLEPGRIH